MTKKNLKKLVKMHPDHAFSFMAEYMVQHRLLPEREARYVPIGKTNSGQVVGGYTLPGYYDPVECNPIIQCYLDNIDSM